MKNSNIYKTLFLTLILCVITYQQGFAQIGPDTFDTEVLDSPIDGFLLYGLIAGGLVGLRKILGRNK